MSISSMLAGRLADRGIHYGWIVVAITFLTMLATAGAMGSAGIMILPLQEEFGWSNAEISSAMALRLLLYGLLGPFAAAFMNQFGVRAVVVFALALIVAGLAGSIFMTSLWQLVLLWGIVIGTGTGMTALVLGATVAARWFTQRRGLVMGLLTASNATGQLIFLPILAAITEAFGWRAALLVAMSMLALAFALMLLLMRNQPSDLGLPAYGEREVAPLALARKSIGQLLLSPVVVLGTAARQPVFWVLFGTFYVCGLSTNGLIQTHWIAICGDMGLAAVTAAGMLALVGAFDFIGTILSGWLSDRFDNRWLLFWFYGLRGLSLIALSMSDFGIAALALFAVFYGMDWVATVPPTVKLTAARFGKEQAGLVFGWIFLGHQLGAATAAFGAGAIRTGYLTYMPALQLAGLMCLAAAVVVINLRKTGAKPAVAAAGAD